VHEPHAVTCVPNAGDCADDARRMRCRQRVTLLRALIVVRFSEPLTPGVSLIVPARIAKRSSDASGTGCDARRI
jgi:hypothetical protein